MTENTRDSTIKTGSVCFISNRAVSTEAALFTAAICKRPVFNAFCLITCCATKIDMIACNEWKQQNRPFRLVLPVNYPENITQKQATTIESAIASSGETVMCHRTGNGVSDELIAQVQLSDVVIVMEISRDHPILDCNLFRLTRQNTAVFQWAVSKKHNRGCRLLMLSGRGTPVYPAFRNRQLDAFLNGQSETGVASRQAELGLV